MTEQTVLDPQMLDVRARLAAASEHQHRLAQHLAAVMDRRALTSPRHRPRQRLTQTQPVREHPKRVEPDMAHRPIAAVFDPRWNRADSLHLSGALLVSLLVVSQSQEKPTSRALVASQVFRVISPRERSGLNGWSLQAFSETKDYQSDVPGAWGSTGLFSAIGALYDSANDADWQGYVNFNVGQNDNVTRWTKGSINQLDPNSFGWNFQTWTS